MSGLLSNLGAGVGVSMIIMSLTVAGFVFGNCVGCDGARALATEVLR